MLDTPCMQWLACQPADGTVKRWGKNRTVLLTRMLQAGMTVKPCFDVGAPANHAGANQFGTTGPAAKALARAVANGVSWWRNKS